MRYTPADLKFLGECCDICVAELSPKTTPAVRRAAEGLRGRYEVIEKILRQAEVGSDDQRVVLRLSAEQQARSLALVLNDFTPAVRLDQHERARLRGVCGKGEQHE